MFTGIVQAIGEVQSKRTLDNSMRFSLAAPEIRSRLALGDSVACDGCCLTVETLTDVGFTVCAIPETLKRTTLGTWDAGHKINLETALTPSTPLGGHFVQGHVDGLAILKRITPKGEGTVEMDFGIPTELWPLMVEKGSITLAGVSLTIAALTEDGVRIGIIPFTLSHTSLGFLREGAAVNVEADMLAKHVARLMSFRQGHIHG